MITGTGWPLSRVGVNSHCSTASTRRLIEQRNRTQHARVLDAAIVADHRFEDDHSLHPGDFAQWPDTPG